MSELTDLMNAGMAEVFAQVRDADGGRIEITYNGKAAQVIPGSQQGQKELRATGTMATGEVLVEMMRTEFARLRLEDRSVVKYGPGEKKMRVKIIDDDPSDPAVRLTLTPHNG